MNFQYLLFGIKNLVKIQNYTFSYCRTHTLRVCLYIAYIACGSALLYMKRLYFFFCTLALSAAATVNNIKIRYDAKTPQFAIFGTRVICVFYSRLHLRLISYSTVLGHNPAGYGPVLIFLLLSLDSSCVVFGYYCRCVKISYSTVLGHNPAGYGPVLVFLLLSLDSSCVVFGYYCRCVRTHIWGCGCAVQIWPSLMSSR